MVSRSPCSSPSTTVQAPQSPSAQPSFVPVFPRSSRRKLRTILVGAIWRTVVISPFNAKEMLSLAADRVCGLDGMGGGSLRSKAALAPQDTRAAGMLSRVVRWRDALNMQPIGVGRHCKACVGRCPSGALMSVPPQLSRTAHPEPFPLWAFPQRGCVLVALYIAATLGPIIILRG